jgi:hypothetical protein
MPGYYFYQPFYKTTRKMFRGDKRIENLSDDDLLRRICATCIRGNDLIARDVSFVEWAWKKDSAIWFLEDDNMMSFLVGSKFEKVSMESIPNMDKHIMLSYPGEYGEKLGGCIVRKISVSQRKKLIKSFAEHCGIGVHEDDISFKSSSEKQDGDLIEIVFCKKCFDSPDGYARYRFIVPEHRFQEALEGNWWQDKEAHSETTVPITDEDIEFERAHFKIAMRALVYAWAFPEALTHGEPNKKSLMGPPDHKSGAKAFFLGRHKEHRTSPCLHLRSSHRRVLKDERYKRNEDGTLREVSVKMAVVAGHDIDPSTLRLLKERFLRLGGK